MNKPIRVLVVDDSAAVRQLLTELLKTDPEIDVIGAAPDPYIARDMIKILNPDVITLDVEMPKMDGITFLRNLMRLHPLPVVMISAMTRRGAETTIQALELGAVDFITKPTNDQVQSIGHYGREIIDKVKTAASARVSQHSARTTGQGAAAPGKPGANPVVLQTDGKFIANRNSILAIGASTGGTEAIRNILAALPASTPGIVITQHIPPAFSGPFAERLDGNSALKVSEARDDQPILPGHAYVAPGDRHLLIQRDDSGYYTRLSHAPPVNRHKPSVDVMFRSVLRHAGADAMAILLTGMGADGAAGLQALQEAGAATVAQDRNSSVVWGMPGAAVKLGAADQVLALKDMPEAIQAWMENARKYGT